MRLTAKINHGELKSDYLIGEVMTGHSISINANTVLADALAMINKRNLRHFPVVDPADTVIGLVTHTDMVPIR